MIEWQVAPRVGAWIEIHVDVTDNKQITVAPRVGAWIEMQKVWFWFAFFFLGRTPCGCVD